MNQITKNNLKTIFLLFSCFYFLNINAQTVTTFAGSTSGLLDGTGTAAQFGLPNGVSVDANGNVFVADTSNSRIRKITATGEVTVLTQAAPQFQYPIGVAVDASGNVFATDIYYNCIRKILTTGVVNTVVCGGTGTAANFDMPYGVAVGNDGTIYVADKNNNRIQKRTTAGVVTTLAGGTFGLADGTGIAAKFNFPLGVAVDAAGNVFVADTSNNRIRKITPTGVVTTFAGSTSGFQDGTGTNAKFKRPYGVAVDASGNVFVADTENNRIRKITSTGIVTTLAGSTQGFADGNGTVAKFDSPRSLAVDATGNIFVADTDNYRIRKISNILANTNFQLQNQVSLYPNPASTFVNIKLEDISASKATILDINGRILQFVIINDNNKTIDISNLDTGIYFIQITTDKGIVSKKFVKQ